MIYDKIILLGTGKLFLDCMAHLKNLGLPFAGYDMSGKPQKITKLQAEKKQLPYYQKEKIEVCKELRSEEEKILLLSVINPCIIPGDILSKENILALNIHQALLPRHKGRNAEAWAIYDGDTVSGITWHKMLAAVDKGAVLSQKQIEITERTTSYQLFRQQLAAAYESFTEFLPAVLKGEETYQIQPEGPSEFRYSYEIPNEGRLDLNWDGSRISRFLRAIDYGGLPVFKPATVALDGEIYTYKSYRITRVEDIPDLGTVKDGDTIIIRKKGYEIVLSKCSVFDVENI
ncbi:MAG: formyltransferase family protein [Eubacteriales bacterium]|nr:formyltransferase family protein [Eubacteriales bacterium]